MSSNDLAYWFPRLPERHSFRVPPTRVVYYPHGDQLVDLCDGRTPDGFEALLDRLRAAIADLGGPPAFLRTGHTSAKHDWAKTCALTDVSKLSQHVYNLVEHSAIADMFGLPLDTWVVRAWLPLKVAFHAFGGTPIAREFRCFVVDDALQCIHPYWPADAIAESVYEPDDADWRDRLKAMNVLREHERAQLALYAMQARSELPGDWSVDFAEHKDGGWYLIDMAAAADSFHAEGCGFAGPQPVA